MSIKDKNLPQNIENLSKMIYGNWVQQCTYAFAELSIADALHNLPMSSEALANKLNLQPSYFRQFLRCVTELGFVTYENESNEYSVTDLGRLLSSNHPHSLKEEARLNGADYRYIPWGNLVSILKNGNSKEYSPTLEDGTLSYLQDKPQSLEVFHNAMFHKWKTEDIKIVESYNFKGFNTVMDIGCGKGSFLDTILEKNSHLKGKYFDLPSTFENTKIDSSKIIQGDFFVEIPDVADLYTMKNVIHNWTESKAIQLMKNIRIAMLSTNGSATPISNKRLLIIENILPDDGNSDISNWMSLNFMILVDGQERNRNEYSELGDATGFRLINIYETGTNRKILEYALK